MGFFCLPSANTVMKLHKPSWVHYWVGILMKLTNFLNSSRTKRNFDGTNLSKSQLSTIFDWLFHSNFALFWNFLRNKVSSWVFFAARNVSVNGRIFVVFFSSSFRRRDSSNLHHPLIADVTLLASFNLMLIQMTVFGVATLKNILIQNLFILFQTYLA